MRHVGRIFGIACVTLSMLVCLALIAVWVRSNTTVDTIAWQRTRAYESGYRAYGDQLQSNRGLLLYIYNRADLQMKPALGAIQSWGTFEHRAFGPDIPIPSSTFWERRGFGEFTLTPRVSNLAATQIDRVIWFPMYLVTIGAAMLPAISGGRWILRKRRSRRRRAIGLCVRCGYDLRESTGRCPECGLAPSPGQGEGRGEGRNVVN